MILPEFHKTQDVEALGHFLGTQRADATPTRRRITAEINAAKEVVLRRFIKKTKPHEAKRAIYQHALTSAEKVYQEFERVSVAPPEWKKPFILLAVALLFIIAEPIFLAPSLDSWGVANPKEQKFLAVMLSAGASGLLKIAYIFYRRLGGGQPTGGDHTTARLLLRWAKAAGKGLLALLFAAFSLFTLLYVAVLGYWRAQAMIFAGQVHPKGALLSFAARHPDTITLLATLAAVAMPVCSTVMITCGFDKAILAVRWRLARRRFFKIKAKSERVSKRIEQLQGARDSVLRELDAKLDARLGALDQSYQLGRDIGAVRIAGAWAGKLVFAFAASLGVFLAVGYVTSLPNYWALAPLFSALVTGGYYLRLRAREECPSVRELFARRAVFWRERPAVQPALSLPADGEPPHRATTQGAARRHSRVANAAANGHAAGNNAAPPVN